MLGKKKQKKQQQQKNINEHRRFFLLSDFSIGSKKTTKADDIFPRTLAAGNMSGVMTIRRGNVYKNDHFMYSLAAAREGFNGTNSSVTSSASGRSSDSETHLYWRYHILFLLAWRFAYRFQSHSRFGKLCLKIVFSLQIICFKRQKDVAHTDHTVLCYQWLVCILEKNNWCFSELLV